jgi:HlyD family secretion protein
MDKSKLRKRIPIVIILVAVAAGLIWWFTRPKTFLYAGTIEATEVDISPGVAAQISAVQVKEGDTVKTGQILAQLAGEDLRLSSQLAESNFRRGAELLASGSITKAAYDQLRTQRDQSALLVRWCTIAAPLDAVVLNKYHEAGEWVRPGVNLFTLGDVSEVWEYIYVEQPMLARLSLGQDVVGLLPEMREHAFKGKITHIRDEAEFTPKNVQTRDERERLVYGVKITFPNPDRILKPGMTVEVNLGSDKK